MKSKDIVNRRIVRIFKSKLGMKEQLDDLRLIKSQAPAKAQDRETVLPDDPINAHSNRPDSRLLRELEELIIEEPGSSNDTKRTFDLHSQSPAVVKLQPSNLKGGVQQLNVLLGYSKS